MARRITAGRLRRRERLSYTGIDDALACRLRFRCRIVERYWLLAPAFCPILRRCTPAGPAPLNYGTSLERITAESLTRGLSGFVLPDMW